MDYCNLPNSKGESDLSSVVEVARFAFGEMITENEFIRRNLPEIVRQLVILSQDKSKFGIKAVHSVLAHFGVNIRGLRKHEDRRMFMEAAFLHLCYRNNVHEDCQYEDVRTLVDNYGVEFFQGADGREMIKLLKYRNYMAIAVKYIHPQQNRDYLLDLITRLSEGSGVRHVPGSGATLATRMRIDIYRKEGDVRKKPRVVRRPLLSADTLPPPPVAGLLKRGRSLDEGGLLKRACSDTRGDGTRVWMSMEEENSLMELFSEFDGGLEGDALDELIKKPSAGPTL